MKNIKKIIHKLSEKNVLLRNIFRKIINLIRQLKYKFLTIGIKVDDKTVIFCAFNGKSYACSP